MTNKELRAQLLIEAADALEESAGRNSAVDRKNKAWFANLYKEDMNRAMDNHDLDTAINKKKDYDYYMKKFKDPKLSIRRNKDFIDENKDIAQVNRDWVNTYNRKNSMKANPIHAKINTKAKNESVANLLMEAAYMLIDEGGF